jgi:hypothetical protein
MEEMAVFGYHQYFYINDRVAALCYYSICEIMRNIHIAPAIAVLENKRLLLVKRGALWTLPHGDVGKKSIDSVCVRLLAEFPEVKVFDAQYYGEFENDVLVKRLMVYRARMRNHKKIPVCDVQKGVAWMTEGQYFNNSFDLSMGAHNVYRWLQGYEIVEK